jgi:hypothetical protein
MKNKYKPHTHYGENREDMGKFGYAIFFSVFFLAFIFILFGMYQTGGWFLTSLMDSVGEEFSAMSQMAQSQMDFDSK